jgi:hypothetical protein
MYPKTNYPSNFTLNPTPSILYSASSFSALELRSEFETEEIHQGIKPY